MPEKPPLKLWTKWDVHGNATYLCNADHFDTAYDHLYFLCEMNGWLQTNDSGQLTEVVESLLNLESNKKIIDDIKSGNQKAIGSLLGQAKKIAGGSLDINLIRTELLDRISRQ